jgi:hypothetical protein
MCPITSALYVSEVTFLTNVSLSYAIGQEIKGLLSLLADKWFLVNTEQSSMITINLLKHTGYF